MHPFLSSVLPIRPYARKWLKYLFIGLISIGLVVSLMPMDSRLGANNLDKLMHASAFFGFALLLSLATLRNFWRWQAPLLLSYGALIEILQAFLPWRSFSLADLAADACGIVLFWLLRNTLLKGLVLHADA